MYMSTCVYVYFLFNVVATVSTAAASRLRTLDAALYFMLNEYHITDRKFFFDFIIHIRYIDAAPSVLESIYLFIIILYFICLYFFHLV